MIIDTIENASLYYPLGDRIRKALDFLKDNVFNDAKPGDYELDERDVYYIVRNYRTKLENECTWESHSRYIDIQYMTEGIERIGYANINKMNVSREYNTEKDKWVLNGVGDFITVTKGTFVILFPEDVHMPCITAGEACEVKKVVVKVRI